MKWQVLGKDRRNRKAVMENNGLAGRVGTMRAGQRRQMIPEGSLRQWRDTGMDS